MSDVPAFSERDDRPHTQGEHISWQESSLYVWYDRKAGVGGFWRLGQEPVAGQLNSCFGVFTDDGQRFRSNVTGAAMAASDRGEGHMGWGPQLRVDWDGHAAIKADFADCEADLRFDDFHPRFDLHAARSLSRQLAGHHFEVSGRMTGSVRVGDREIQVDALGYRDRSWGDRDWSQIRATRWWPCVFGPDLSLHLSHVVVAPGVVMSQGYMWRNGQLLLVADSNILVQLESDALTPFTGEASFRLENGEQLAVRCERSDGIVLHVRGYTAVETIGVAYFDGREGMSNLEVCTNAAGGSSPPVATLGSNNGQGLSKRS